MRNPRHLTLNFPYRGISDARSFDAQERYTTPDCQNVRSWEMVEGRSRGGQRPGLTKYINSQPNGDYAIQDICSVVSPNMASQSGNRLMVRIVSGVVVSNGSVFRYQDGVFSPATNGTGALSAARQVIFSASAFGKVYFADGVSTKYYDPVTNTVSTWTPTAGTLPANGASKPRLIELWYGRVVMSGLPDDPHNWFMSRIGDPDDWDYAPDVLTELDAVAGNSSNLGLIGDIVTSIVPYSEDLIWFGGDRSIWQLTGNPLAGGRLDQVSDTIGMAWGRPWCRDAVGTIYFVGSRGGLYSMRPNQVPDRLSGRDVDRRMSQMNMDRTIVRLAWSDVEQGVYMFFTPLDDVRADNWFYDTRNKAFFRDQFATSGMYPKAVHLFDGDRPDDRRILLGCKDGYVRTINESAKDDDGEAIDSYAYLGPLYATQADVPFLVAEIQPTLSTRSDGATISIYAGPSAEEAFYRMDGTITLTLSNGDAITTDTGDTLVWPSVTRSRWSKNFDSGRNHATHPRIRGAAAYLKIGNNSADEAWQMENVRVRIDDIPSSKRRQLT